MMFKIGDRVRIISHEIPEMFPNDYPPHSGGTSRTRFLEQSGGLSGRIESIISQDHDDEANSWVWVLWDHGVNNPYPCGYLMYDENHHTLMEPPDITLEEIEAYQALVGEL
jgi:hypothetical protein